jgi:hypothetical protein
MLRKVTDFLASPTFVILGIIVVAIVCLLVDIPSNR